MRRIKEIKKEKKKSFKIILKKTTDKILIKKGTKVNSRKIIKIMNGSLVKIGFFFFNILILPLVLLAI